MDSKVCEECRYYTRKCGIPNIGDIDWCVKHKRRTEENLYCDDFDNSLNCYDCNQRSEFHYDIDDIEHYCKETGRLVFQQLRSILYKGDFEEYRIVKNKCSKMK